MPEKKQSADWYIAATHYLTAGFAIPFVVSLIAGFIFSPIIGKSSPILNAIIVLPIKLIGFCLGVVYSSKWVSRYYLIKDANKIITIATAYSVLLPVWYQIYRITKNFSAITLIEAGFFVAFVFVFYFLSKKYLQNSDLSVAQQLNSSTQQSLISQKSANRIQKIILIIFSIIIIIVGIFLIFYFWPIKINSDTVSDINSGLGETRRGDDYNWNGLDFGYNWDVLPGGVRVGYLVNIKYKDDNKTFKSSCIMERQSGIVSRDQYYCQATWSSDFSGSTSISNKYNLDKYSFTARPTISILWEEVRDFFKKSLPYLPVLKIETEYSLPRAQQGEPYNASINILYTGSSPLMATFIGLPAGIFVSGGIVNGNIEIKNQKGALIISGIPTEGSSSYEAFLTISSEDGKSKETKQFNLFVK